MKDEIDIDYLISLVKLRPVLWDKTLPTYKDRYQIKNAWQEICILLKSNFDELEDEEKNEFGKAVMKKWINVRDAFVKSKKKLDKLKKSGGRCNVRQYVYNDQLQFLNKTCEEQPSEDSQSNKEITVTSHFLSREENSQNNSSTDIASRRVEDDKTTQRKSDSKKRKLDASEVKNAETTEEFRNRHLSFFKGIIPSLIKFDEDDVIQFQMGVLQLISKIKNKNNFTSPHVQMINHPQSTPNQSVVIQIPYNGINPNHVSIPTIAVPTTLDTTNQYYDGFVQQIPEQPSGFVRAMSPIVCISPSPSNTSSDSAESFDFH